MSKFSTKHPKLAIAFNAAAQDLKKYGRGYAMMLGGATVGSAARVAFGWDALSLGTFGVAYGVAIAEAAGLTYIAVKALRNSNKP